MTCTRAGVDPRQRGYAMAALLVAMSVMAVALGAALPVFQTVARREREAELVFRGEQYARAIGMFQRKYANALPPDVDALLNERFLRKRYKDPITGDDFKLLGPGSPELAEALAAAPATDAQDRAGAGGTPGRGAGGGRFGAARVQPDDRLTAAARGTTAGGAPGGILAVTSTSTDESFREYNGKGRYNEWLFMALQASQTAGAPVGAGGPAGGINEGVGRGRGGGERGGGAARGLGRGGRGAR